MFKRIILLLFVLSFYSTFVFFAIKTNFYQSAKVKLTKEKQQCDQILNKISKLFKTFGTIRPYKASLELRNQSKLLNIPIVAEWIVDNYYKDFINYSNQTKYVSNNDLKQIIDLIDNPNNDFSLEELIKTYGKLSNKRVAILNWFQSD